MSSHDGYSQFPAGSGYLVEDLLNEALRRTSLGQEDGRLKPLRLCPSDGDIVGIDMNRIPPDFIHGKGDGVRFRHQVSIGKIDDGGILADLWSDD